MRYRTVISVFSGLAGAAAFAARAVPAASITSGTHAVIDTRPCAAVHAAPLEATIDTRLNFVIRSAGAEIDTLTPSGTLLFVR